MQMNEFVVWLANGQYLAEILPGDRQARSTADIEEAQRFPTRLAALGACSRGPAAFFDHAAIQPYRPQERPAPGRLQDATAEPERAPEPARRQNEGK